MWAGVVAIVITEALMFFGWKFAVANCFIKSPNFDIHDEETLLKGF